MYTAYVLDEETRTKLEKRFPPKYPDFIGHHVTVEFGVPKDTEAPEQPSTVKVVGHADDLNGIEALVVAVNGKTKRPDGSIYHITWSIDRDAGRKPVDSNKVLQKGYTKVEPEISINVTPKVLK